VGHRAEVGRGVVPGHRSIHGGSKLGNDQVSDRANERRSIRNVLVERWAADADTLGDRAHDHAIESFLLEEGAGGFDDGIAGRAGWGWHIASIGY
jgi:hypothetical protein